MKRTKNKNAKCKSKIEFSINQLAQKHIIPDANFKSSIANVYPLGVRAWIWSRRQNLLSVTIRCETIESQLIVQNEAKSNGTKERRKKGIGKRASRSLPEREVHAWART